MSVGAKNYRKKNMNISGIRIWSPFVLPLKEDDRGTANSIEVENKRCVSIFKQGDNGL